MLWISNMSFQLNTLNYNKGKWDLVKGTQTRRIHQYPNINKQYVDVDISAFLVRRSLVDRCGASIYVEDKFQKLCSNLTFRHDISLCQREAINYLFSNRGIMVKGMLVQCNLPSTAIPWSFQY